MRTTLRITLLVAAFASLAALAARGVPAQGGARLDDQTRGALVAALDDERHAQAIYYAVLERYGDVLPFARVVEAEARHEALLLPLFEKYGVPVPENAWKDKKPTAPSTLEEACKAAIAFEQANVAMYDRFLGFVREPDVRSAFEYNRSASADHHLRAFERCGGGSASQAGPARPGRGYGRGWGPGGPGMGPGGRCCCRAGS